MIKYQKVARCLENRISEQNLPQNSKLPSVEQIMEEFCVSKSTITKALTLLENKGIIYQVQGSGIFVRRQKREGYLSFHTPRGFTDSLKEFEITSKVLELCIMDAEKDVAFNLNIAVNDKVYYVKRIRYINQEILCIEESYFPIKIIPYLNQEIARSSIFTYFKNALKITIGFSESYMQVIKLNAKDAELLNLYEGNPSLMLEQIYYLTTGEIFDYSVLTYHYKHARFFIPSSKI